MREPANPISRPGTGPDHPLSGRPKSGPRMAASPAAMTGFGARAGPSPTRRTRLARPDAGRRAAPVARVVIPMNAPCVTGKPGWPRSRSVPPQSSRSPISWRSRRRTRDLALRTATGVTPNRAAMGGKSGSPVQSVNSKARAGSGTTGQGGPPSLVWIPSPTRSRPAAVGRAGKTPVLPRSTNASAGSTSVRPSCWPSPDFSDRPASRSKAEQSAKNAALLRSGQPI